MKPIIIKVMTLLYKCIPMLKTLYLPKLGGYTHIELISKKK